MSNNIDETLTKHRLEPGEFTYALKQALYQDLMALAEPYDIDGSSSPDAPKTELAIPVKSINQYFKRGEIDG